MGCDIHMFAEVRKSDKWEKVGKVFESGYSFENNPTEEPYSMRNYGLFAILADVRTRADIKPICDPKGVPSDASEEWLSYVEMWDGDGHSHSFFTVKELLDFDWEKIVNYSDKPETYRETAGRFYDYTIPKLQELGNPEDVRIVFLFDN